MVLNYSSVRCTICFDNFYVIFCFIKTPHKSGFQNECSCFSCSQIYRLGRAPQVFPDNVIRDPLIDVRGAGSPSSPPHVFSVAAWAFSQCSVHSVKICGISITLSWSIISLPPQVWRFAMRTHSCNILQHKSAFRKRYIRKNSEENRHKLIGVFLQWHRTGRPSFTPAVRQCLTCSWLFTRDAHERH